MQCVNLQGGANPIRHMLMRGPLLPLHPQRLFSLASGPGVRSERLTRSGSSPAPAMATPCIITDARAQRAEAACIMHADSCSTECLRVSPSSFSSLDEQGVCPAQHAQSFQQPTTNNTQILSPAAGSSSDPIESSALRDRGSDHTALQRAVSLLRQGQVHLHQITLNLNTRYPKNLNPPTPSPTPKPEAGSRHPH